MFYTKDCKKELWHLVLITEAEKYIDFQKYNPPNLSDV